MEFVGDRFAVDKDFTIISDEMRFQQVILNLLSNAIKFTFKGQITIKLEYVDELVIFSPPHQSQGNARNIGDDGKNSIIVMPSMCYDKIRVSVEDTGIGITPLDQKRLFQMFGIVKTTRQLNTKGVGLGLAICKMISNAFGGDITVESEVGKGSKFIFFFELKNNLVESESEESEFIKSENQSSDDQIIEAVKEENDSHETFVQNKENQLSQHTFEIAKENDVLFEKKLSLKKESTEP